MYLQRPEQVAKSVSPDRSHETAGAQLAWMKVAFPTWQAGLVASGVMEQLQKPGQKKGDGTWEAGGLVLAQKEVIPRGSGMAGRSLAGACISDLLT